MGRPIRFLHASDLHLEQPPTGLSQIPDHLQQTLLTAPYRAAENVFAAAIAEEVDFVLLAGDVLDPRKAGPRGLVFLTQQFEQLAERGIEVYWAGGLVDPAAAVRDVTDWPRNVHFFSGGGVVRHVFRRDGRPAATLLGAERAPTGRVPVSKFRLRNDDRETIAVAHGAVSNLVAERLETAYLALGGRHSRMTFEATDRLAHYPGSPQGRSPLESGPHGCSLVEIGGQPHVALRPIVTDVLRWRHERVELDEAFSVERLEQRLAQRVESLQETTPGQTLLIHWTLTGEAAAVQALRRQEADVRIVERLRNDFGFAAPIAWTESLSIGPPSELPERWYEQETILGEFLRMAREQEQQEADLSSGFESLLDERQLAGAVGDWLRLDDASQRRSVLERATVLGSELLRPEDDVPTLS